MMHYLSPLLKLLTPSLITATLIIGCASQSEYANERNTPRETDPELANLMGDDATMQTPPNSQSRHNYSRRYMQSQEEQLRAALSPTGISVIREGDTLSLFMPGSISFDSGRAALNADILPALNAIAEVMAQFENTTIQIAGYTDSTGPRELNVELSEERAHEVADYLIRQGVDVARLQTVGYGPDYPIASNNNPDGRAINRRVEISLLPNMLE